MPSKGTRKQAAPAAEDLLLEPSLLALRKYLATSDCGEQQCSLQLPADTTQLETGLDPAVDVSIIGAGAPAGGGCKLRRELLLRCSAYYRHAASFGDPPASIQLESGHRGVRLLAAALAAGSAALGPATLPDLLQAASYLQVPSVLDAAGGYLQAALLERQPGLALRLALDLGLAPLAAHIEREFLEDFFMLCGDRAAELLKEWPPARRHELLGSPRLNAPSECCVLETLCRLAKRASSADAAALLDCVCWGCMTADEAAAAALFLQHNAGWVDRRLSTAAAWRLLNARVARDLSGLGQRGNIGSSSGGGRGSEPGLSQRAADGGGGRGGGRLSRRRCLLWGLSTASLAAWSGTQVPCTARRIPCTFQRGCGGGTAGAGGAEGTSSAGGGASDGASDAAVRPMFMQLEREDPRHAAAEAVGGVTGGGGAADSGGSGWDLQLSLDPDKFPAGFRAVCWAFGAEGFFWCGLGPLVKPGPTWWKVGFLESQLLRALPLRLLHGGGGSSGLAAAAAGDNDGLLLLGWWVPEQ